MVVPHRKCDSSREHARQEDDQSVKEEVGRRVQKQLHGCMCVWRDISGEARCNAFEMLLPANEHRSIRGRSAVWHWDCDMLSAKTSLCQNRNSLMAAKRARSAFSWT